MQIAKAFDKFLDIVKKEMLVLLAAATTKMQHLTKIDIASCFLYIEFDNHKFLHRMERQIFPNEGFSKKVIF